MSYNMNTRWGNFEVNRERKCENCCRLLYQFSVLRQKKVISICLNKHSIRYKFRRSMQ